MNTSPPLFFCFVDDETRESLPRSGRTMRSPLPNNNADTCNDIDRQTHAMLNKCSPFFFGQK